MRCATLGISASSPASTAMELEGVGLRRSRSEPQLRRSSIRLPTPRLRTSRSMESLPFSIAGSILPIPSIDAEGREETSAAAAFEKEKTSKKRPANWVQKICEVGSRLRDFQRKDEDTIWEEYGCGVSYESEEEVEDEKREWGREAFGRLLNRASWSETKLFSQLAFLCHMAYVIPEIKADELRSYYGLWLVTTSLDKKQEAAIKAKLESDSTYTSSYPVRLNLGPPSPVRSTPSSSVAYEIAASAASYLHNRAKRLLSLGAQSSVDGVQKHAQYTDVASECQGRTYKSKVATYVAASSVTSVVGAEENARLEAARDLQSLHSSPCEWFVCDEPNTCTRCFVIQGSDTLGSWQANLFFEPTKFEGTDAVVHRGIYEAAKGIYEQFMPEIEAHILAHGKHSRFRFTGHSLGGSLSLLISLMLLARNVIPRSALHPIVTFGSPAVFCGGERTLEALGLDETNIRAVMMHRDIVPRAFSCDYPSHVAHVLKRLNSSLRSHPCLNANKLLYSPLGKQYILQPDEKFSPPHPLLPAGAALYAFNGDGEPGAIRAFLNTPHPLEMLSHPTAYGSEGTILRDHDSSNYLMAINALLRQHTRVFVRRSRRQRLNHCWPLLTGPTAAHKSLPFHTWPAHHVEPVREVVSGV